MTIVVESPTLQLMRSTLPPVEKRNKKCSQKLRFWAISSSWNPNHLLTKSIHLKGKILNLQVTCAEQMSCKILFRYLASCACTCKNLARFLLSWKKLARDLFFARNLHDFSKSCIFSISVPKWIVIKNIPLLSGCGVVWSFLLSFC